MNDTKMQPGQDSQGIWITIFIILVIIIAILAIYFYKQSTPQESAVIPTYTATVTTSATSSATSTSTSTTAGQTFSNTKFTYICPSDWTLGTNKNYNGQVELSECAKIYSGTMSFDDGIDINIGYVPQTVADSIDNATGQKYADTILNQVKNETNAQTYTNNNFSGFVSMQTNAHTLALVARYPVSGGYYEVTATAMGNTKTSQQYEQMVNDIVSTFKIK